MLGRRRSCRLVWYWTENSIQASTSRANEMVRTNCPDDGETIQVRDHLLRTWLQYQLGSRGVFTVHSHTSSVLSLVGHELVDPETRGVENFENRSGEEFYENSLLLSL